MSDPDSQRAQQGFDPHVMSQLNHLSQNNRGNNRGRGDRGLYRASRRGDRGQRHAYHSSTAPATPVWSSPNTANIPGPEAFPALGSNRPTNNSSAPVYVATPPQTTTDDTAQSAAQTFFERARGRGKGQNSRQNNRGQPMQLSHNYGPQSYGQQGAPSNYARPQPHQNSRLFHPPSQNGYYASSEQQKASRQKLMVQADFLNAVSHVALQNSLTRKEIDEKHNFRKRLEDIARNLMHHDPHYQGKQLQLHSYGSLSNSFGTKGCDMDLMLTIEDENRVYMDVSDDLKRAYEKALLDAGHGARLLTNTRVPILKVCETPPAPLLETLRLNRQTWELEQVNATNPTKAKGTDLVPPDSSINSDDVITKDLEELKIAAVDTPLPPSPAPNHSLLEFTDDCGIQSDINFTNHVALANTQLLWTYGQCDVRVRQLGLFVKYWAKARDINTPYHGTLSSYGYVLMVLHYLMNVARPPVIPNLQAEAVGWNPQPRGEGEFDTRFVSNPQDVQNILAQMPKNHDSLGALLRGFFAHYATQSGFNWTNDVISIRSPSGVITKRSKGWTGAKWSEQKQNVRLRYLLAIEDPFELQHNIARTVGHHGIVAIRNEFRRAWQIIEGVRMQGSAGQLTWSWSSRDQTEHGDGMDLVAKYYDRGDLLRKDADERKAKLREMREKAEQAERQVAHEDEDEVASSSQIGTFDKQMKSSNGDLDDEERVALIHDYQYQDHKLSRLYKKGRLSDAQADHDASLHARESVQAPQLSEADEVHQSPQINHSHDTRSTSPPNDFYDTYLPPREKRAAHSARAAIGTIQQRPATIVEWTTASAGGRWLRRRDRWIREGTFVPPSQPPEASLNARFPYNPYISPEALDVSNQKLEKLYSETLYPRLHPADQTCVDSNKAISQVVPPVQKQSDDELVLKTPPPLDEHTFEQAETDERDFLHHRDAEYFTADGPNESQRDAVRRQGLEAGPTKWSCRTPVGRWLTWRDNNILHNKWTPPPSGSDSIFARIDGLYPYEVTDADHLRSLNAELDTHFYNVPLPEYNTGSSAELAFKAVLRVIDGRKDEPGAEKGSMSMPRSERTQVLLDLLNLHLKRDGADVAGNTKIAPGGDVKPPSQSDIDALHRVVSNTQRDDESFIRQRRLAFYTKNNCDQQSDSFSPNPYVQSEASSPVKPVQRSLSHRDASTDEAYEMSSVDGVIPMTLRPDTWQNDLQRHPDEDPRIMPIPRHDDFKFDARHLADLAVIRAGGNGCAKTGHEFSIETERRPWNGGGSMGQLMSPEMSVTSSSAPQNQQHSGIDDDSQGAREALQDLPYSDW